MGNSGILPIPMFHVRFYNLLMFIYIGHTGNMLFFAMFSDTKYANENTQGFIQRVGGPRNIPPPDLLFPTLKFGYLAVTYL